MDLELNRLIKEAKSGNQEAFSTLVTKYKGHVFRHAYAVLNNRQDAEDVAQEAFVKAFLSLKKLDNEFAFVSWLTRIVSNLCYDKLKKAKNIQIVDTDDEKQEHLLKGRIYTGSRRLTLDFKRSLADFICRASYSSCPAGYPGLLL